MKKTIKLKDTIFKLDKPKIMGILNVSPDSFYKDSRINASDKGFLKKAEKMLEEGADILDIGGYSTRPGAENIEIDTEIERTEIAIKKIRKEFPQSVISIDTFRSEVAITAIDAGADIINDVSGGTLDIDMWKTVLDLNVPYILMHMRGNPKNMQQLNQYNDLEFEIYTELISKALKLKKEGINDIIIDPGFGFAKDLDQNYKILKNLDVFVNPYFPILVGLSRKSLIYKYLEIEIEETLTESVFLSIYAILKRASIIRTHDIQKYKNGIKLFEKLLNS